MHDALEVALFLLRLSRNLVPRAAIDELALVPPPDDVVDGGHEAAAAVGGGGGEGGGAAAAVCASNDADLLLRRAEHADADAASASSILDARGKVGRLPGRRR